MNMTLIGLLMALAAAPEDGATPQDMTAQTALWQQDQSSDAREQLSSKALARGETDRAIARLEQALDQQPDDPALLINLGIALAQNGDDAKAQTMFERALVSSKPISLETAEGKLVDSRRLARKAIRMLERGEFSGN